MNNRSEEIRLLEKENEFLKKQLAAFQADKSRYAYFEEIMIRNKEAIFVLSDKVKGSVDYVSESISIYGYSPEEFTSGKLSFWDIVHKDDADRLQGKSSKNKSFASKVFESDFRIYNKGGLNVWIAGTLISMAGSEGMAEQHILKINNITTRKKYEAELLDANKNLFTTLKSIGESVILMNSEGYINQLNAAAEKTIGTINLKAKNKRLSELVQFSIFPDFSDVIDPLATDRDVRKIFRMDKVYMKSIFGKVYHVSCSLSPVFVKNTLTGYVMVVKDLTAVYNSLQTAQENEQALQAKLDLLLSGDITVTDIRLTDLIYSEQLRMLQDKFSAATGVSSVILDASGNPVIKSGTVPNISASSGEEQEMTFEAKAPICVGEKLIAEWKIYLPCSAEDNRDEVHRRFRTIHALLQLITSELSEISYNNVKLAHELIKGRENEKKLFDSNALLEGIINTIPMPVFVKNNGGNHVRINDILSEKSGNDRKNDSDFPYYSEIIREAEKIFQTNSKLREAEVHIETKSGKKDAIVCRNTYRDGNGENKGMVEVIFDTTSLKNIERELITEKRRLQSLGDNFPDGCLFRFVYDTRTDRMNIAYLSRTWDKMSGIPRKEAAKDINLAFSNMNPDDVAVYLQAVNKSVTDLSNINIEIRYHSGDNITKWMQISSQPRKEDRNVIYDGFMLDVTNRKQIEQELIMEKDRLQALGDNLPNGCLFRSSKNRKTGEMHILYISKAWERLSGGVNMESALKDANVALNMILPEDIGNYLRAFADSAKNLGNINTEVRFKTGSGTVNWAQITAHPHLEGDTVVWDGIITDITQRKDTELKLNSYRLDLENIVKDRTEELEASNEELYVTNEELYATNEEFAVVNEELHVKNEQLQEEIMTRKQIMQQLEDSEKKMRSYIEQSIEGIVILDDEGIVTEWNAAQEEITGISRFDAIGQYLWDIYTSIMSEDVIEAFGNEFRNRILRLINSRDTGISENSEYNFYDSTGTLRYLHLLEFPIGLAGRNFLGQIVRDITEDKMIDFELEKYRTQLEDMVKAQTKELIHSKERLTSLSDNLPGGIIYQIVEDKVGNAKFTYISARFSEILGLDVDAVMADSSLFYSKIHPEDREKIFKGYQKISGKGNVDMEIRIRPVPGNIKWIHLRSSNNIMDDGSCVRDGFMIDVTAKKYAEQELEETRKRQNMLIKILQIIQSSENIPDALNVALAEMGKYSGVSRVYIFEKNPDSRFASNTYEWCNKGVTPEIEGLQKVPIEWMQDWFDIFEAGEYICASDIKTLSPIACERLSLQNIKSVLVLPLESNGVIYGFVGFDECKEHKEWKPRDVDLLITLSQIISTTTRRYWAETSTKLSQQTMRTVLDNINASIYVTDPDSMEILFANKKLKEQAGYDIEGKICWSVIHGLDAPCEHCLKPKLLGSKNKPSGLFNREAYDSRQNRWYECADAAIEWVDGRLVYMEYATDITDRKKAEVALRQSEEMYRQLTVASPDAIVVSDFAGKPVFLSDKAKEMFLVGDKNISGLRLFRYVHPHDLRGAFETFRMFAQDNVAFLPQLLLKRNDGSEFFGEISSASVKNATGDTEFIIMIIRDITDRKMNEIDLINAKEKAEESDKLKSAFLANMSHEIRTPINGIIGFLNFLGDENLSRKKRQEYINVVNNSSTQLVKLIDDIIDVAKIEAKQMSIRPVPFHLNDFMRELQVFFETYLQANNKDKIALVLDDSEFIDSCVTYVDPMRLRQVLSNLIGNAVKFTEKGYIRFGYRQISSSKLEFTVEDSGIGLAEDQLEIIFERFRQAELNNDRHYGGTGLGLTISRSLVYLMGGNLNVESIKGVGSTFHFTISYLPVTPEEEHLFNEKEADSEILGKPQKNSFILMVEPEYMKSSYYSKLLADTGAELIVVQTIKEWIDAITQRKYIDIVLVNSTVFENEDMETIKQVKSVRAGLPLIMFVPACDDYYMQISSILQCNKIIREPADMSKLKEILKKYL